ncbi:MAG: IS21 family transposase [Gammaproteobacteria bacterium]|nr:IS21 family transposase [Gammaproteobacteria bacterium]
MHRELSRPGLTRQLLWQEYKQQHPQGGLQYSAFCDHYRDWLKTQCEPVLRFEHRAGEKCFVDYAGQTLNIIDRYTGEIQPATNLRRRAGLLQLHLCRSLCDANAPRLAGAHVRALAYFGGAPGAFVPDNLKSGVQRAHRYEPELNRAYAEFAEHYNVAILPARVRKPRDKAKVEGAVLIVERWILARLRDRQFFSLAELNIAIAELLIELNERPFQKLEGSRRSRFMELDRPALQALPARAYEYAQWKCAKVHPDYHIEFEHAYYSVPYQHIGAQVQVRITARMLEIFLSAELVATHPRLFKRGARSTLEVHRPHQHRAVIDASLARLIERANRISPAVGAVLTAQFNRKRHPEEALRVAQGILRLAQDFSPGQLLAACERALKLNACSYRSLRALITTPPTESGESRQSSLVHENVRGPDYFH